MLTNTPKEWRWVGYFCELESFTIADKVVKRSSLANSANRGTVPTIF